jgi:hypothetical protein
MERTAMHVAAAWATYHERSRRSPTIVSGANHVDNLVEGAADEIHKLKLGHRTQARERCAKRRADNGRLGDRRVDDTFRTEAVDKSIGDFESASVYADVLTNAEDTGVAFHLLPDSLADGFEIGSRWHEGSLAKVRT